MLNWARAHTKHIIGAAIILLIVLIGVGTYMVADRGHMAVDEDTNKAYNHYPDKKTVDYYNTVCQSVDTVTQASRHFITVQADTVGEDPQQVAQAYKDKAGELQDTMRTAHTRLEHVDHNAPTVYAVDGTKFDFHGAISPLLTSLAEGDKNIGGVLDTQDLTSDEPQTQSRATQRVTQTATKAVSASTQALSDVFQSAPLLSKATKKEVTTHGACHDIFGGDFAGKDDDKKVVRDLVDFMVTVRTQYNAVDAAFDQLNGDIDDSSLAAARSELISIFTGIRDAARTQSQQVGVWRVKSPEGSAEYRAAVKAVPYQEHVVQVADDTAVWAGGVVHRLEGVSSVDGLNGVTDSLSGEVRDHVVAEARVVTEASTQLPIPTWGTSEKIRQELGDREDKQQE